MESFKCHVDEILDSVVDQARTWADKNANLNSTTERVGSLGNSASEKVSNLHHDSSSHDSLLEISDSDHCDAARRCPVKDCPHEPPHTQLLSHLERHCQGIFSGDVPSGWLESNERFVCKCKRIVSLSRRQWHIQRYHPSDISIENSTYSVQLQNSIEPSLNVQPLPNLLEVFSLRKPTLKFIPRSARRQAAKVFSEAMLEIITTNSVESWTKFFMIPKCVFPSIKRAGKRHKLPSISNFCQRWLNGEILPLWNEAKNSTNLHDRNLKLVSPEKESRYRSEAAISLAESGLYGKACRILSSKGLAPNTASTWEMLQQKHPSAPEPDSIQSDNPLQLPDDYNIEHVLRHFPKDTACGPSGLRVQHLLDIIGINLPTSLSSSLRRIINLLLSGIAPTSISPIIASANLTALKKNENDVRPIAVGEVLRRIASKCVCDLISTKSRQHFEPLQFGVSCPSGMEKVIYRLRSVTSLHWNDDNFCVCKIDFRNAFNSISRQRVLNLCDQYFPELCSWVSYCYGQHPYLFHPIGTLTSMTGVQQGDPLGPFLFSIVLHEVVTQISADDDSLLFHAWYLDDGVICGDKNTIKSIIRKLSTISDSTGLILNLRKCEIYSPTSLEDFSDDFRKSNYPNFEILGSPIGDEEFCKDYIMKKREVAYTLLHELTLLGNPQIALTLLRQCGSFCKMVHIARTTPPSLSGNSFVAFDNDVRRCLEESLAIETTEMAWKQAQLSMKYGGFGLRSVDQHQGACYITSFSKSVSSSLDRNVDIEHAILHYNSQVKEEYKIKSSRDLPTSQRLLSTRIEKSQFESMLENASTMDKARLLSVSAPHSSSWLQVVPSAGLNLNIQPNEMSVLGRWWLGMDVFSSDTTCPRCPNVHHDSVGYHALTCRRGPDINMRHNKLRDDLADFCRLASLRPQVERGASEDDDLSRPADILLPVWDLGRPAALDLTVVHPQATTVIHSASTTVGSCVAAAEQRKREHNGGKCDRLRWLCVPFAMSAFGEFGDTANELLKRLAVRISIQQQMPLRIATREIYGRLGISLMRCNAQAIITRLPN